MLFPPFVCVRSFAAALVVKHVLIDSAVLTKFPRPTCISRQSSVFRETVIFGRTESSCQFLIRSLGLIFDTENWPHGPCRFRPRLARQRGASAGSPYNLEETRATVGKFLGVSVGKSLLVGLITDVTLQADPVLRDTDHVAVGKLDLIGEILDRGTASEHFRRGVATYPAIGDAVAFIGSRELRLIFQTSGSRMIDVGICIRTVRSSRGSMSKRC